MNYYITMWYTVTVTAMPYKHSLSDYEDDTRFSFETLTMHNHTYAIRDL